MRLRGITVLLVEDDVDNLELLASFLDGEGARTFAAGSIAGALVQTADEDVDIVISDLELADGDGCALLTALRERDGRTDRPAIAVTGYSEQKWRAKACACGFTRFAVKPYSLERLIDWVIELTASRPGLANADFCHGASPPGARDRLAR